jgi:hypothetical protein
VFSFGANDATLEEGLPRCAPDDSVANLERGLDLAEELGLRTFVVGPAAIDVEDQNDRIAALSARFATLCDGRGTPYVALVERLRHSTVWRSELAAADGAHPGAAGYAEATELVLAGGWLEWLGS